MSYSVVYGRPRLGPGSVHIPFEVEFSGSIERVNAVTVGLLAGHVLLSTIVHPPDAAQATCAEVPLTADAARHLIRQLEQHVLKLEADAA